MKEPYERTTNPGGDISRRIQLRYGYCLRRKEGEKKDKKLRASDYGFSDVAAPRRMPPAPIKQPMPRLE
ncbi:hypothetical protein CBR_g26092 [Chara braunii]|uniref:Uncharacterized protein n=1 Tax=Chara braunii TaxID=69332 RepID=A0A388JVT8_CHABU|nr:hypothetical protein CBR_g26092 [Chara braunii]|eukprot:GBG61929.1 hypothetical protein CBR_g26092 [Chara braunii]